MLEWAFSRFHPDERAEHETDARRRLELGEPIQITRARFRRVDDTYIYLDTSVTPTFDERGRRTGWQGVALDVTAEVEEEHRRQRIAQLTHHGMDGDGAGSASVPDLPEIPGGIA